MKHCSSCGEHNPDEAKFCLHCGAALNKTNAKSNFERNMDHFGEEVEKIGKRIEESFEQTGKNIETWYDRTFGFFGPLLSAMIAFVIFFIIISIFSFLGDQYEWMERVSLFLQPFLLLFLLVFLLSSYSQYFNKKIKPFRYVSPVIGAIIFLVWFWAAIRILLIIAEEFNLGVIQTFANLFEMLIIPLAVLILLLGYVGILTSTSFDSKTKEYKKQETKNHSTEPYTKKQEPYKRLYRSGNEQILGGVLGGIAEYLKVDPVIIRIVYVLLLFASFGFMVLAYIVAWIIIPRNPNHHW